MSELRLSEFIQAQTNRPDSIRQTMKMTERHSLKKLGVKPGNIISYAESRVNHEAPRPLRDTYVAISKNRNRFQTSGTCTAPGGSPECRHQLAAMEKEIFGMNLTKRNILIGMGSTQITGDLLTTLADPGDAVMTLDPTYPDYPGRIELAVHGARVVRLKALDDTEWLYMPNPKRTIEEFRELFERHSPRIVLAPALDNPTGQNPDEGLVREMRDITADAGSYLVLDFAYKNLFFGEEPPSYYGWSPAEHENLVCIGTTSNWARGQGRRLGWMEASPGVIAGMERTQELRMLCPDGLHQLAISEYLKSALRDGSLKEYVDKTRSIYEETAKITVRAIHRHLGLRRLIPRGGLNTVVDVEQDAQEFVRRIFKKTGVLFMPGGAFGPSLKNGIRISYGPYVNTPHAMEKGLERVGVALDRELN